MAFLRWDPYTVMTILYIHLIFFFRTKRAMLMKLGQFVMCFLLACTSGLCAYNLVLFKDIFMIPPTLFTTGGRGGPTIRVNIELAGFCRS